MKTDLLLNVILFFVLIKSSISATYVVSGPEFNGTELLI